MASRAIPRTDCCIGRSWLQLVQKLQSCNQMRAERQIIFSTCAVLLVEYTKTAFLLRLDNLEKVVEL